MAIDPRYGIFGGAIAKRRVQLKLTQTALAARVGLSRASIANIEGGRQNVLLHHALDIVEALSLNQVGDLLPAAPRTSLEDQALVLSEPVGPRATLQINDMIATALASTKAKP